ncbi:MAG: HD domain-containing protein [Oscillospiraceae bacterium]|nr:HD domain-containing protein [Oscillospiraceae bacterium]
MRAKDDQKPLRYIGFAVLTLLFIASIVIVPRVSRSGEMLIIGNTMLPMSAFAGVVSLLANICLIIMVVFYGKTGFIAAVVMLLSQLPIWARNLIVTRQMASLPGIFSTILTFLVIVVIRSRDKKIDQFQQEKLEQLTKQKDLSVRLFEQSALSLVTAIDAKDEYSRGHSMRVAEYSRKIAEAMGKSEEECRKIYYAGLLHDVGKIGISDAIITKKGKLTPEEYEEVRRHPVLGNQILSSIRDYPYISIGAHYHHERYDGKGYPDGLKGEDIPEIARIISVADAYDAMSSNRSYRRAIPQQIIREEIVAGAGTQFDPEIAMIMRHLIDLDGEYRMKERETVSELAGDNEMHCGEYRSEISGGILINQEITRIHLAYRDEEPRDEQTAPAIILFDSLDARVHDDEQTIQNLNYYEYCEIWLNGKIVNHGVRAIKSTAEESASTAVETEGTAVYDLEAVRCRDHMLIRVMDGKKITEITVALPDSSRYAYIALTGKNCFISDVHIDKSDEKVADDYIPRIAEEISYINGPEGDIPNVQIDGVRSAASEGIPVKDRMLLSFHTMSLPTARLIWHCPYIVLFYSADGKVNGEGYREYTAIRLDGENWENDNHIQGRIIVNREDGFEGWDAWKRGNKEGFDCTVQFRREGNRITVSTENLGLSVKGITILPEEMTDKDNPVYASLTGDQCALTNIRIREEQV